MAIESLTFAQEQFSEKHLNEPANAPEVIERYVYNAKDLKGIRYVEEGINIHGSLKYIREDLIEKLKEPK